MGLAPLMRGEIRAVETRLVGPQLSIGLNSLGHVDWPAMAPQTETVAIERLNIEDGRVVLTDAASNSRLVLDKLWFRGQVRSLTGPFRGEGAFVSNGEIYGYRIAAGPAHRRRHQGQTQRRYRRTASRHRGGRRWCGRSQQRRVSTEACRCRGRRVR